MTWDYNTLKLVNTKVNMIEYVSQIGDDWNPFTENGFDCNNYATRKMEELSARGVPASAMRLATGWVEPNHKGYHAWLFVDCDGTTYALCNRYPLPMEHDMLPYELHRIQIAGTQTWEWAQGADKTIS